MRVLIVHDREAVAEELKLVVLGAASEAHLDIRGDFLEARDALHQGFYDLMVLDLTLPMEKGDNDPSLANAQRLLRQIQQDPRCKQPADILGITNDLDALELVKNSIGEHVMASIAEDADDTWKKKVAEKVRYVRGSRHSRDKVSQSTYDFDVGIITALDKEAEPYSTLFGLRDSGYRDINQFTFRSKNDLLRRGALLKIGRSGQAPAASETQAFISLFRPRLLLMTGFCGGRAERTKPGDLIAFTTSYAWDYGKWVNPEVENEPPTFEPRPTPLSVEENGIDHVIRSMIAAGVEHSAELHEQVRGLSANKVDGWRVRRAAAASGSAVVTSDEVLGRIKDLDENIYAIDMESYGFYLACRQTRMVRPDFMCLKAVADFCNGQKDSHLHQACSLISASFVKRLITREYDF